MRRSRRIILVGMFWGIAVVAQDARPCRAETLGEGWPWRRALAFKQAVCDAPGENCAWAEFYANGMQLGEGADIRVTTADRQIVTHKVMEISKASDFVRVAFATKADGPYYVWWGNAKPDQAGVRELEIRRGILLDVMRVDARPAVAIEAASGAHLASYFLPEMSLGFNPYGDDRGVMLRYRGQFKIDRAITPQMAFTASDVGLLMVDGREVIRERGGLRGRVRDPFPVILETGWHGAEVRQVNQNQGNVAMAVVWQRPGEKNYSTLPGALFAPVARAIPGVLEKVGASFTADFTIDPTAEGFIPPSQYVQRYTFEAQYPTAMKPVISWAFGDGQEIAGLRRVSHIFLAPGTYPVTLKLDFGGAGVTSSTMRVTVKDRMYARFPRPAEDPPRLIQTVLQEYDPKKLSADSALRGVLFFENASDPEAMIKWGRAWLEAKETAGIPENMVADETFALVRMLTARKQYKDAAEFYRLASLKPMGREMQARMMRREVTVLCDYADDVEAAVKEAQEWVTRSGGGRSTAAGLAQEALAHAAIAKGDGKAAKAAIDAAIASVPAATLSGAGRGASLLNQQEIRQGVLARNIENYIRTKDFDEAWQLADQWDEAFPQAIWDGFTRILRVKLMAAEGHNLAAARMAVAHARANPEGFYAAELLFRASENFKLGGEQGSSRTVMELLRSKYPESPYAGK